MENKIQGFLDRFNFKKVEMNVFSKEKNGENNRITYYLLVVDEVIIVDYKIKFKQISIKDKTTKSHEKRKDPVIDYRKDILKKLGIKHEFAEGNKESIFINDHNKINEINKYIASRDFASDVTFKNIEYILCGYNPRGEGKSGRGYFNIKYDNQEVSFNLFLKSINQCKEFRKEYNIYDFEEIYNNNLIETIEFQTWINNNSLLKNYWNKFKKYHENWKTIRSDFEKKCKKLTKSFYRVDNEIRKFRNEQKREIKKILNQNESTYLQYFDISNIKEDFEYAHIKPVWLIKKEYLLTNDSNKLDEIKDINNFLPLPANIHQSYDKKQFYWTHNGTIKKLINNKLPNNIDDFSKINSEILKKISHFIDEYERKIILKIQ